MSNLGSQIALSILVLIQPFGARANTLDGFPLSPMRGDHSLIAGSPAPGFLDGEFSDARFNRPSSVIKHGDRLYVADSGNGAIRVVDLAHANRVSTLAARAEGLVEPKVLTEGFDGSSLLVLDAGLGRIAKLPYSGGSIEWLSATAQGGIVTMSKPDDGQGCLAAVLNGKALQILCPQVDGSLTLSATVSLPAPGRDVIDILPRGTNILAIRGKRWVSGTLESWTLVGGGHLPWKSPAAAVSLSGSAMEAVTLTAGLATVPTGFLHGQPQVTILNRLEPFAVKEMPSGHFYPLWILDEFGNAVATDATRTAQSGLKALGFDDAFETNKHTFDGLSGAVYDPPTKTWYLCDPENNCILSYRDLGAELLGPITDRPVIPDFPAEPGIHRQTVWVSGSSVGYYSGPAPGGYFRSFSRRLQKHLNVLSAYLGDDRSYDVAFVGSNEGHTESGMSSTCALLSRLEGSSHLPRPDMVVILINPDELIFNAMEFGKRRLNADGLPMAPFDPETIDDPDRLATLDKDYQELYREVASEKDFVMLGAVTRFKTLFIKAGPMTKIFSHDLAKPGRFGRVCSFTSRLLDGVDTKIKKRFEVDGNPKPRIILVAYPSGYFFHSGMHPQFENVEADTAPVISYLARTAAKLNWGFIDVITPAFSQEAEFPNFYLKDMHPTGKAQDSFAFLTAFRLLVSPRIR